MIHTCFLKDRPRVIHLQFSTDNDTTGAQSLSIFGIIWDYVEFFSINNVCVLIIGRRNYLKNTNYNIYFTH